MRNTLTSTRDRARTAARRVGRPLAIAVLHLPRATRVLSELAGLACAAKFLHAVWTPLIWALLAVVLVVAGQERRR